MKSHVPNACAFTISACTPILVNISLPMSSFVCSSNVSYWCSLVLPFLDGVTLVTFSEVCSYAKQACHAYKPVKNPVVYVKETHREQTSMIRKIWNNLEVRNRTTLKPWVTQDPEWKRFELTKSSGAWVRNGGECSCYGVEGNRIFCFPPSFEFYQNENSEFISNGDFYIVQAEKVGDCKSKSLVIPGLGDDDTIFYVHFEPSTYVLSILYLPHNRLQFRDYFANQSEIRKFELATYTLISSNRTSLDEVHFVANGISQTKLISIRLNDYFNLPAILGIIFPKIMYDPDISWKNTRLIMLEESEDDRGNCEGSLFKIEEYVSSDGSLNLKSKFWLNCGNFFPLGIAANLILHPTEKGNEDAFYELGLYDWELGCSVKTISLDNYHHYIDVDRTGLIPGSSCFFVVASESDATRIFDRTFAFDFCGVNFLPDFLE